MTEIISFAHPEPKPTSARIWPIFLPFAGCPYRCVYCAQDKVTGQDEGKLEDVLRTLETDLNAALSDGRGPYELAFYGGTFTALPEPWTQIFLSVGQRYKKRGLITRIRCSTRPDRLDLEELTALSAQGLDMVELGIQSFDDTVLRKSSRGYSGETARQACKLVKQARLALGVQLLPGLPGDRPGVFQNDVKEAAALKPEVARIYPCIVIRDTPLADIWEQGDFEPWGLNRTREELAAALPVLWEAGIHIIRLGLPPEGTLADNVLAGPWHPALGQSARGLTLMDVVRKQVKKLGHKPTLLEVPRRYQGELMGHGNELAEMYDQLGLPKETIRYTDSSSFSLS
jgi:histone acetyltransferase (RNA polymerase elongator complex component)